MNRELLQQCLDLITELDKDGVVCELGLILELRNALGIPDKLKMKAELAKPAQPDLRKAVEMAVPLLIGYREYSGDHRIANRCGEVLEALRTALAQPEQKLDYPPECTTPEMKVAYAAGWWKALEVQRNKQQALDKKATNARELGLDYEAEPEPFEYWNAVEGWVKLDEIRKHFEMVGCGTIYKTAGEGRKPLYTAPPKREQAEHDKFSFCGRVLDWNRKQEKPPIEITKEYWVAQELWNLFYAAQPEQKPVKKALRLKPHECICGYSIGHPLIPKCICKPEYTAQPEHPLDKNADNARELGLDYEPDVYTKQGNLNTLDKRVQKSDEFIHEWVSLTDDEINDFDKKLRDNGDYCSLHFAWGISAKLKEKNNAV